MFELQIPAESNRLLHTWARWHHEESYSKGYPKRSPLFATGGSSSVDAFAHLCEESDSQTAKSVDALIDNLPLRDRAAIYYHYLGSIWREPGDPFQAVQDATEHFLTVAREKGIAI